ncbi:MAG: DUF882 domain-containing protein [Rhodospirillales bacterium]
MATDAGGGRISRRHFFAISAAGTAALATAPSWARDPAEWNQADFNWGRAKLAVGRSLAFRHTHTDESLNVTYYENGRYLPQALDEINYLFRDFRSDEVKEIDPRLLDTLYAIRLRMETDEPFDILSAYRTPETNAMLRRNGWGAARNSLHIQGMAIDIRLPDRDSRYVARTARDMERGGVGYYPRANFVHVDSGSVRTWMG